MLLTADLPDPRNENLNFVGVEWLLYQEAIEYTRNFTN